MEVSFWKSGDLWKIDAENTFVEAIIRPKDFLYQPLIKSLSDSYRGEFYVYGIGWEIIEVEDGENYLEIRVEFRCFKELRTMIKDERVADAFLEMLKPYIESYISDMIVIPPVKSSKAHYELYPPANQIIEIDISDNTIKGKLTDIIEDEEEGIYEEEAGQFTLSIDKDLIPVYSGIVNRLAYSCWVGNYLIPIEYIDKEALKEALIPFIDLESFEKLYAFYKETYGDTMESVEEALEEFRSLEKEIFREIERKGYLIPEWFAKQCRRTRRKP